MVQTRASHYEAAEEHPDGIAYFLSARRGQLNAALAQLDSSALSELGRLLLKVLRSGHKVLLAGNGGSAAEAEHFAGELVGRLYHNREPYAALALTTDSAVVTAVANDFGFRQVFVRQVRALGNPGDLLVVLSTSGESENLVLAARAAHERGMTVAAMTGARESRLAALADLTIRAPGVDPTLIQEIHMVTTHLLCCLVEREMGGV